MALAAAKPPDRLRSRDVPEKHGSIAANRCECRVVLCDGNVEDFVPMRGVGLDKLRRLR